MKRIMYKSLVVLLIISLLLTFMASNKPAFASQKSVTTYNVLGAISSTKNFALQIVCLGKNLQKHLN